MFPYNLCLYPKPRAFLFHWVSSTFLHIYALNYKPSYLSFIFRSSLHLNLSHDKKNGSLENQSQPLSNPS